MHTVKSSISLSHNNVSETVQDLISVISSAGLIRHPSITAVDFHGPFPSSLLFCLLLDCLAKEMSPLRCSLALDFRP